MTLLATEKGGGKIWTRKGFFVILKYPKNVKKYSVVMS